MANQVSSGINPYLEDLYREIEKMHEPPKGWCDIPHCRHCELAEQKIQAAKDAAARACGRGAEVRLGLGSIRLVGIR